MDALPKITETLSQLPADHLSFVVVLAGFALAAWAIYVVHQNNKPPKGKR